MIRLVPPINLMTTPDERKAADRAENAEADAKGLRCPKCGCRHMPAVYSKPKADGRVQRQRECRNCGRKIVTVERILHNGGE
jgi:ribosomal protein S27E